MKGGQFPKLNSILSLPKRDTRVRAMTALRMSAFPASARTQRADEGHGYKLPLPSSTFRTSTQPLPLIPCPSISYLTLFACAVSDQTLASMHSRCNEGARAAILRKLTQCCLRRPCGSSRWQYSFVFVVTSHDAGHQTLTARVSLCYGLIQSLRTEASRHHQF